MEQTANQTPAPASKKKKKWPKILGGVTRPYHCGGRDWPFILLPAWWEWWKSSWSSSAGATSKGAYGLTSKDFQKTTSLEQFTLS
jgi:hypothetical protein